MSDTHSCVEKGQLPFDIPDGDVFLHAGDFTDYGEVHKVKEFNEWLGKLPHRHKIVVAGNHDVTFDPKASAEGTRWRSRIEHPDMDKVGTVRVRNTETPVPGDIHTYLSGVTFYLDRR